MVDEEDFFFEQEGIDPERIANDEHQIVNEFVCAICQCLLWQPRSCASCQHLFCNKCIQTWLKINPNSCPYRCSPYQQKRAPPYIHSLLARLSIHCRNSSFGCTEILPYDALEQHETFECQFPTKQCRICRKYILLSEINQHEISCRPTTIECFLCKSFVNPALFQQHTIECFKERLDLLIEEIIPPPDPLEIPMNNPIAFLQEEGYDNWLIHLVNQAHRFLSTLPKIDLIGFEAAVQARRQSIWTRMSTMFLLIWFNKLQAVKMMILFLCFGIGGIGGVLVCLSLLIHKQVEMSMYRSFVFIILFSGLFGFGLPILLTSISDTLIITCTVIGSILYSSAVQNFPLDYLRLSFNYIIISVLYIFLFSIIKVSLLMIRTYFWYIPPYISAGGLAWIIIFLTFYNR
jgi:hypothetical protein